jgi:hypothetical protein
MKRKLFPVFITALILSLALISCDVIEALIGNTYEVTVTGGEGSGTYAVGSIKKRTRYILSEYTGYAFLHWRAGGSAAEKHSVARLL